MLEVREVHSLYGDARVLHGVSMTVPERQVVALLGRNGMGKTSLIRSIMGFAQPRVERGAITYRGRVLTGLASHAIAMLGIGLVPQGRRLFASLSVEEHLTLRSPDGVWTLARIFELFPALAERRRHRGSQLSGGERQMLAIAGALMCRPSLLLVDELSLGLAPVVVQDLTRRLLAVRDQLGIAILLVEQSAAVALTIADHAYVMENGRIVLDGDRERLKSHQDVQEFYLGQASGERRSYRTVKQYRRSRRWYG